MPVARRQRAKLPEGEEGQELIEHWRHLLDPDTPIAEFFAQYEVPTKKLIHEPGAKKKRAMVKFIEYPYQVAMRNVIETQWAMGEGGKLYATKGRQEGGSVEMGALAWERFMRGGGGTGNYYSYDDAHSMESFALQLKFKKQTPDWVFEYLVGESEPGACDGGGLWTKKSHRQLELTLPDAEGTSLLQCWTAGGEYSGSGSAPRWVFLDEFTKYPSKVKDDFTGMSEGWYDGPGNIFALWGTGQGNEQYAKMFMERFGREIERGQFYAYFKNWLGHPMRRTEFQSDEERERFKATIGQLREFGTLEEQALDSAGAIPEELLWRRNKLSGPAFRYNVRLFAREYPLLVQDAFRAESGTIFQVELLRTHDAAVQAKDRKGVSGDFIEKDDEVLFVPSYSGSWTVYEEARDDMIVCFGADSASGKTKIAGSGAEPDFSTAQFDEVYSGRTVAEFRAHREGRVLGLELLLAARYYKARLKSGEEFFARGYPEVNAESGAAMMAAMTRWCEEHGHDLREFVLYQEHPTISDGTRSPPTLGWTQSKTARGTLIDCTKAFIQEVGAYDPAGETPYTLAFLREAYNFSRIPSKTGHGEGRIEASTGHDDMVFAKMLAVMARDVLLTTDQVPVRSAVKIVESEDPIDVFWRGVAEQRKAKRKEGSSQYLGSAF